MAPIFPWPTTRWGYVEVKLEPLDPCRFFGGPLTLYCRDNGVPFPKLAVVLQGY